MGVPLTSNSPFKRKGKQEDFREQRRNMNYALYGTNIPNVEQKQQFRQAQARNAAKQEATANMLQARVADILGSYRQQNKPTLSTGALSTGRTSTGSTSTGSTSTGTTATPTTATPTTSAGMPPASIARPTAPTLGGGMIDGKPAGLRLREMRLAAEERYKRGEGPKPFGPSAGERRYEAFEEKQKQFEDYEKGMAERPTKGVPSSIRRSLMGEELPSPYATAYRGGQTSEATPAASEATPAADQADNKEILDLIESEYGPEAAGREPSNDGAPEIPVIPEITYIDESFGDGPSDVYDDLGSAQPFFDREAQIEEQYAKGREAIRDLIKADQEAESQASRGFYNTLGMGASGVGKSANALFGGRPSKEQSRPFGTAYDVVYRARGEGSPEERVAANIKQATEKAIRQRERNQYYKPVQDRAKEALREYRRGFDY